MAACASSPASFPFLQFLHEQHVRALLDHCQYHFLIVASHDSVHLEVPEPFPVGLGRTLVYAHPVRYYNSLPDQLVPVFQVMPAMLVEATPVLVLVLSYDTINGFVRNLVSHSCKITGYLLW